ncbi:MAG: DUF3565 domain-containing protein [Anaerolineae bacterium]|nr:DUF3565 domain-containing protein [Anaerolineae bacterium]
MERKVVGFHTDENGDWAADLECGHRQHVRHNPPFETRVWVTHEAGRQSKLGQTLNCLHCDEEDAVLSGS